MMEILKGTKKKVYLKNLKINRRHTYIGHTIGHIEFVVNILEGAIFEKYGLEETSTTILKASYQNHRS